MPLALRALSPVSQVGSTPLHLAARKGNVKVVKTLIAKRANVFAKDVSLWLEVAAAGETERCVA